MLLTVQVKVTFVAPSPTTRPWNRCQAATKSLLRPQLYQLPFISHQRERKNGCPQALAACAHFLIAASWLPLTTSARVVPVDKPIVTIGIAPRASVASIAALSKVSHDCPWLRIATLRPACRSKRSQAAVSSGAWLSFACP